MESAEIVLNFFVKKSRNVCRDDSRPCALLSAPVASGNRIHGLDENATRLARGVLHFATTRPTRVPTVYRVGCRSESRATCCSIVDRICAGVYRCRASIHAYRASDMHRAHGNFGEASLHLRELCGEYHLRPRNGSFRVDDAYAPQKPPATPWE